MLQALAEHILKADKAPLDDEEEEEERDEPALLDAGKAGPTLFSALKAFKAEAGADAALQVRCAEKGGRP